MQKRMQRGATQLVVPALLQMGWIELPLYFRAASETARDVTSQYIEAAVGQLSISCGAVVIWLRANGEAGARQQ